MKRICLLIPMITLFIGCSQDVTEEYLIGGHWVGTAGYEDGKVTGDPDCYPFHEGIEFKDEEIVYVDAYERDFDYRIQEYKDRFVLEFYDRSIIRSYTIQIEDDNEMGFIGEGTSQGERSCYLERE